ncbi:MAG TPA: DegT/DnrJ/EryC1/StrS family aminotransferase [Ktedonobacteraceae bacterium]|nr:DegT/DnrJ/EryC1/StrS family aminotransferase [Ktedonobacteraceae bacterium]
MIPIARPLIGVEEEEAVLAVLKSGQLAQGERVAEFEKRFAEFCQVQEAVAVSSGTAALHLALIAHEISYGDEVITTPFTFAATTNVILLVGAIPVFVDIDPETCNIDVSLVEAAITPRTKAILPVHLYGNPCDMERLQGIAAGHHLSIIEDACQAHGASIHGKPVGSFGTGCFSFYPTKNMTTGEGGMVTTSDSTIADRVRLLRNHGQKERYCHVALGFNLRMTELQAALGLAQFEKLEHFTGQRRSNAAYLTEKLGEAVQTPVEYEGYRHVYHQYTIRVPEESNRDEWAAQLLDRGIGTAVHYPLPMHMQPFYQESKDFYRIAARPLDEEEIATIVKTPTGPLNGGGATTMTATRPAEAATRQLHEAEKAARQVLSLPVYPSLSEDELATIVKEVLALCQ